MKRVSPTILSYLPTQFKDRLMSCVYRKIWCIWECVVRLTKWDVDGARYDSKWFMEFHYDYSHLLHKQPKECFFRKEFLAKLGALYIHNSMLGVLKQWGVESLRFDVLSEMNFWPLHQRCGRGKVSSSGNDGKTMTVSWHAIAEAPRQAYDSCSGRGGVDIRFNNKSDDWVAEKKRQQLVSGLDCPVLYTVARAVKKCGIMRDSGSSCCECKNTF